MNYLKTFWNWLIADDLDEDDEIKFNDSKATFEYTLSDEKYHQYTEAIAKLLTEYEQSLPGVLNNDFLFYKSMFHSYVFNCFLTDVPHDVCFSNIIDKFPVIKKSVKQKVRKGIPRC